MLCDTGAPGGGNLCCRIQPLLPLRHAGGDHGADERSDSGSDSSERKTELFNEGLKVGEWAWCSKSSREAVMEPLSYKSSIFVTAQRGEEFRMRLKKV